MPRQPEYRQNRWWQSSRAIAVILAVVVVGAVAFAIYVSQTPYLRGEDAVFEGEQGIRPAGSGTVPDEAADSEYGGLTEGVNPDEAVDQTINADNVPALLQSEQGDPIPQTSAEGLEPIDEESGAVLPEIADETEMTVPGAGGEQDPSADAAASGEEQTGEAAASDEEQTDSQ